MEDEDLFDAMQRLLGVSGHVLAAGDDVVAGDIVGHRYVLLDIDEPATARLFSSLEDLREDVEATLQQSLHALGASRYVQAIDQGDIARDEFLALVGDDGEAWLAKGEKAALARSLPPSAAVGGPAQPRRL